MPCHFMVWCCLHSPWRTTTLALDSLLLLLLVLQICHFCGVLAPAPIADGVFCILRGVGRRNYSEIRAHNFLLFVKNLTDYGI